MKYRDIKSFHMQDCIDNCGCGYSTQWAIKNLFGHLDKFALELDVINKSYAQLTTAESIPETSKEPFTDDEVDLLWKHQDEPGVDSVLLFLYTGFRISEMLDLEKINIDLVERTFKGGTKTNAGKDRIIPIHSKVFKIVEKMMNSDGIYLISNNGKKYSKYEYYQLWDEVMNRYGLNHTPHECRHTLR